MTNEQKRVVAECIPIIRKAALQIFLADSHLDREILDSVLDSATKDLDRVCETLSHLLMQDAAAAAEARAKSLPRLLNEGIL